MNNDKLYKKIYIKAVFLLIIFLLSFFAGFTIFAVKIIGYKLSMALICSFIVSIILFWDFAKLSALTVVQFTDIDFDEDIPDNKVIRIKDYLRKKGRIK